MSEKTQSTREHSPKGRLIEGSALGLGVILALALFAMVNYLGLRHYQRFDWTSSQIYSLSEKSENVLGALDRPIDLIVFLNPGSQIYPAVDELLSRYEAANPELVDKRVVDPARNLVEARRLVEEYGIERDNVVVVASGDDRRVIDEYDLADYDYSGAQFGQAPTLEAFKGEQLVTSAILELVEDRKPRILLTTGHGEATSSPGQGRSFSLARSLLGEDNFDIEEWGSLGKTEVPPGIDLLIVAGPQSSFLASELEVFSSYLESGGRILTLLDPVLDPESLGPGYGLETWLAEHGIELGQDLVIDPANTLPFFGAETVFTDSYGIHPIVDSLAQTRTPVLLPLARSVRPAESPPEGWEVTELVRTSEEGWAERGLAELPDAVEGEGDLAGPVSLAVAAVFAREDETEDESTPPESRLVVFGDFDFAADDQISSGANANLLLNTLNWLVERDELLAIEPRRPEQTSLLLSSSEVQSIYWLVLLILPGAAAVMGIFVYLRRRR